MEKLKKGLIAEAEAMFVSLLEERPSDSEARFGLGLSQFRLKAFARSQATFSALTTAEPNHYLGWYYLGLSQERLGDHAEAIKAFRRSLTINPSFAKAAEKLSALQSDRPESDPASRVPVAKAIDQGLGDAASSLGRLSPGELRIDTHRRVSSFTGMWSLLFLSVLWCGYLYWQDAGLQSEIFLISVAVVVLLFLGLSMRSRATVYRIYEGRIDVQKGVLFRKSDTVWMYDIEDVQYKQSPLESLTRNATITVDTARGATAGKPERITLRGIDNASAVRELWEWIRDRAVVERRAMKGVWT